MFAFGALGAFISFAVVLVLPYGLALMGGAEPTFSRGRFLGAFIVVVIFLSLGGTTALILGDVTHIRQAIVYGIGWQSSVGGLVQGARTIPHG